MFALTSGWPTSRATPCEIGKLMKKTVFRLGLVIALAIPAFAAQARTDGQRAVGGIGERLGANDCEGAIKNLNAGLSAGYPEVALMAGTMFEAGACVRRDWNKAVRFYSLANEGGMREGALRLAAGFAAAANGPDMAAAMWWATRAGLQADLCTARLPKTDDPDRFVEALRAWPARELAVCNYVVGMIAFVTADVRYPMAGVTREIEGRLDIVYQPALVKFTARPIGGTGPAGLHMNDVWVRALHFAGARYPQPAGIDPAWKISFEVVVETDKSRWW
jgi:hypothetical protein